MNKKRIIQHSSGIIVGITIIAIPILLFQSQPIKNYTREYDTLNVIPGQEVTVNSEVYRNDACTGNIVREFYDESGNLIGKPKYLYQHLMPAGVEHYTAKIKIPEEAEPGFLKMVVKVNFYCNFLQRFFGFGSDFVMSDIIFKVSPSTTTEKGE